MFYENEDNLGSLMIGHSIALLFGAIVMLLASKGINITLTPKITLVYSLLRSILSFFGTGYFEENIFLVGDLLSIIYFAGSPTDAISNAKPYWIAMSIKNIAISIVLLLAVLAGNFTE